MSPVARVRLLYSKTGRAAFVPHADLPDLLSRAALRAGVELERTQGFSPHPRLSLGPALPVGIEALAEPGELWIESPSVEDREGELNLVCRLRSCLPVGFDVRASARVEGGSLSGFCAGAEYLIRFVSEEKALLAGRWEGNEKVRDAEAPFGPVPGLILGPGRVCLGREMRLLLRDPERNGMASWVKGWAEAGIADWPDLRILRVAVGFLGPEGVRPLLPLHEEE
jgi:hypothetical protein